MALSCSAKACRKKRDINARDVLHAMRAIAAAHVEVRKASDPLRYDADAVAGKSQALKK